MSSKRKYHTTTKLKQNKMKQGEFRGVFEELSQANHIYKKKRNRGDYCFIIELGSGIFIVGKDGFFHDASSYKM